MEVRGQGGEQASQVKLCKIRIDIFLALAFIYFLFERHRVDKKPNYHLLFCTHKLYYRALHPRGIRV